MFDAMSLQFSRWNFAGGHWMIGKKVSILMAKVDRIKHFSVAMY
jgi:hypothetical protein